MVEIQKILTNYDKDGTRKSDARNLIDTDGVGKPSTYINWRQPTETPKSGSRILIYYKCKFDNIFKTCIDLWWDGTVIEYFPYAIGWIYEDELNFPDPDTDIVDLIDVVKTVSQDEAIKELKKWKKL